MKGTVLGIEKKEIYDKQGKPNYYTCRKYPNAPFIVFKKEIYSKA